MDADVTDGKAIGALVRRARQKAGLTQEELAAKTGLSVRTIGDLERGLTTKPHRSSLELLAEVLELPESARTHLLGTSHRLPMQDIADLPHDRHPDGLPVPAQLPTDIADFTGRGGQVEQFCGLLSGSRGGQGPAAVRLALVAGSGGLGKTTFAVHLAHVLAPQFRDGQLYVNLLGATQPLDPAEVLARFLRDFGLDHHKPARRIRAAWRGERRRGRRSRRAGRRAPAGIT
jgi:transcriptional regulator with XRE-family HTH domain